MELKYKLYLVLGVILALVGSYTAGYYSKPNKIEYKDRVEYKEKIVTVVKTVKVRDSTKNTNHTRTEVRRPDGTVEIHEEDKTRTETSSHTNTDSSTDLTASSKHETMKLEINDKPSWRVSAKAGLNIGNLSINKDLQSQIIYGAQVDRRIFGTFWLGIWGMSNKTGGLALSMEF